MKTMEAVEILDALAQQTRLEAFRLVVKAGPDGLAAGLISDALGIAPPTMSFHLKELRNAGVIKSERHGRNIVHRADYVRMGELLGYLTENCCRGVSIEGSDAA